jgi:tetratricopeptide (TPR) repeat protein
MTANTLDQAFTAYGQGKFDEARELYERSRDSDPANAAAPMLGGLIAKKQLRFEDAILLLEKSVQMTPAPVALYNLAECLWRVGRLEQALHYIDRLLAGSADNLDALLFKAGILHGLRRFDVALECVRSARSLAPDSYLVAARSGCILTELGQFDAAEADFQNAALLAHSLRHCGLINFRHSVWRQIDPPAAAASSEEFASLRQADITGPYDAVVMACCDAVYFRKYGNTFVNSYAQNAAQRKLLHLHILDPEDGFADYIERLITRIGLSNVAVTYEYAPMDEEPDFNLRRTFYSCARFLRMGALLKHYQRPIACFDIDTVFETAVDDMLASVGAADVGLVRREPPDSPWLDIVANIVIARNSDRTMRYFSAVANFIRHFVGRGKSYWHLDQIALYCVLKMMERFDEAPRVASLTTAACAAIWHIGNPYEYRLKEQRVARYQIDDVALGAARP